MVKSHSQITCHGENPHHQVDLAVRQEDSLDVVFVPCLPLGPDGCPHANSKHEDVEQHHHDETGDVHSHVSLKRTTATLARGLRGLKKKKKKKRRCRHFSLDTELEKHIKSKEGAGRGRSLKRGYILNFAAVQHNIISKLPASRNECQCRL